MTPFPWVLVHTRFRLPPPRVESVSPCPVIKFHGPWRSDSLGISGPFAGSSGWEAWHEAQKLHNSERTSLVFIVLQIVGYQPSRYGIWFYRVCTPLTISLLLLLCLWMWDTFFLGRFQHPPVDGCSKASCDFGALSGDECLSFYSAHLQPEVM